MAPPQKKKRDEHDDSKAESKKQRISNDHDEIKEDGSQSIGVFDDLLNTTNAANQREELPYTITGRYIGLKLTVTKDFLDACQKPLDKMQSAAASSSTEEEEVDDEDYEFCETGDDYYDDEDGVSQSDYASDDDNEKDKSNEDHESKTIILTG